MAVDLGIKELSKKKKTRFRVTTVDNLRRISGWILREIPGVVKNSERNITTLLTCCRVND